MTIVKRLFTLLVLLSLVGCAGAMRNYKTELNETTNLIKAGSLDSAIAQLETNNTSKEKDLLYFLEKSELLTLKQSYEEALSLRLEADQKIKVWEEESKVTVSNVAKGAGSLIVNDKVRRYDGRDYEKVFLNSRLVANKLLLGQWDDARVEVKKMHEREALIAEFRAKEIEKSEAEAKEKGINTQYKDLKGYPVELLDDPEVEKLKNSYQNAYTHYLSGYLYESFGERGLAASGYRKAIELKPNTPLLEDALKSVDTRYKTIKRDQSDVLLVYETGLAPAYDSMSIPIPLPLGGGLGITPISFPLVKDTDNGSLIDSIFNDSKKIELAQVTNINNMAKRALKDEMPGIILRSVVRATSKAVAQAVANEADSTGISGLILMIGGFVVEGADERMWRLLPSNISVGRTILPKGNAKLRIPVNSGFLDKEVNISSRFTVLNIRELGGNIYINQANSPEQLDLIANTELEKVKSIKAQEPKKVIKKAPKRKKSKI
jgi:hypothetical protein